MEAEMRAQISLTVPESKRVIAKGIAAMPAVRKAFRSGRIFLKGGTTVSAVCQELTGKPMLIAGRISPQGTKMAQVYSAQYHCALLEKGRLLAVDDILEQTLETLRPEDVVVIGANIIDAFGNAAMMYGVALGGKPGRVISGLMSETKNLIVAAGLEKLVPGSLTEVIANTGRLNVDLSMGMAVGLTPIIGKIITEKEAVPLLADVTCMVIGKGGISGAEGATTLIVEGAEKEVKRVFQLILSLKGAGVSGIAESLPDCIAPHEKCKVHRACIYKRKKLSEKS
jgi:hypothetical protein